MLSYELCKRLKEAGFPQESEWEYFSNHDGGHYLVFRFEEGHPGGESECRCPTLEDLLRELGDELAYLERTFTHERVNKKVIWAARDCLGEYCVGDTPEEALCHLWLALHPIQPKA